MTAPTAPEDHAASSNGRAGTAPDIAGRLEELHEELRTGEQRLRELDTERERVRDTLLRIEGAILALKELSEPSSVPD
jgi:hypothetical protein